MLDSIKQTFYNNKQIRAKFVIQTNNICLQSGKYEVFQNRKGGKVMKSEDRIFIGVDPGFDSIKVVINGYYLKFPKEVADITGIEDARFLGKKNKSFLKVNYIDGKQHLVGEYAATFLSEQGGKIPNGIEESERLHDTFETFKTVDKQILIMAAIAKGLLNYVQKSGSKQLVIVDREDGTHDVKVVGMSKIYVNIALPHDAVDESWKYIETWLKNQHKFSIETSDGVYNFDLDTKRSMVGSQVISALYGVLTDDNGAVLDDENNGVLGDDRLPAIVIDGGYLTLGVAHFTSVKLVDDSDSNLQFAMKNIYENVAATIREESGREEVTSIVVKQVMRKKEHTINYVDQDGNGHTIDVEKIVKDETRSVCEKMVTELKAKYNNLVDIKSVIITGGTGIAYYEHIKEMLSPCKWINVILTDYEFFGEKITPDYAIVIGAYKVLHGTVDEMDRQKGR